MKALNMTLAAFLIAGSVAAAPCFVGVTAQPTMPVAGTPVSIHYGAIYRFFLNAPAISISGNQITIDQFAAVADPVQIGVIPCADSLVSVGVLQPGAYQVTVNMGFLGSMSGSFVISTPTVSACSRVDSAPWTGPDSGVPSLSVTVDRGDVRLHFENQGFLEYVGTGDFQGPVTGTPVVQTESHRIVVSQSYEPPVPSGTTTVQTMASYARFCQSEDVDLGMLAPGTYVLVWTYNTPSGPVPVTLTFSNGAAGRRRSASH
jgi:hypothetical protein